MPDDALVAEFDQEMHRIYERALSEAKYPATRFLHMLYEHRGLETARILLHSPKVSEGYTALWERGRLDLTVEAVIHDNPKWHPLFTPDDLAICISGLRSIAISPENERVMHAHKLQRLTVFLLGLR